MQSPIEQILRLIVYAGTEWFHFIDDHSVGALLILAIACLLASKTVAVPRVSYFPYAMSGVIMFCYFLSHFAEACHDLVQLLEALIRALLSYHIVGNAFSVGLSAQANFVRPIGRAASKLVWTIRNCLTAGVRTWYALKPQEAPQISVPPPEPLVVPRADRLRQIAQDAQADYEMEVAALTALSLDEDEREVLVLEAKQRLLERMGRLPAG